MAFAIVICLMDLAWGGERNKKAINANAFALKCEKTCQLCGPLTVMCLAWAMNRVKSGFSMLQM